jgi:outer membrane protein TolC
MKRLSLLIINCSLLIINSAAQEPLSLQKAYDLAQQNYPLVKQRELIRQTTGYTVDNLSKGFLPQVSLNGQATYQSEVTQVKIPVPGVTVDPLSKDQYKILADEPADMTAA